jgi:formate dehydrogenase accessory protein FdhE
MAPANSARWDERIARARFLATRHPAAADLLTFYAALAGYQQSLAARWSAAAAAQPRSAPFVEGIDTDLVLDAVPELLRWLHRHAPAGVADSATELRRSDRAAWRAVLEDCVRGAAKGNDDEPRVASMEFVLETLIQPLAEQLAARRSLDGPAVEGGTNRCPFCGSPPAIGVLREEGEGARRGLSCGLCLTEWRYQRVVCPACGEREFDALPVFTAEQFPGARLDACDSCRKYLKTIDATKDGLAIPLVDDFASPSLDLWAREHGYVRLRPNLIRV